MYCLIAFSFVFFAVSAEAEECLKPIVNFYEDINCKPVFSDKDNKCPIRFDCSEFESRNKSMCRHHGISYSQGSTLPSNCQFAACRCGPDGLFTCANVECFDPPPPPNCVRIYKEGECCSRKNYCKGEDAALPECIYETANEKGEKVTKTYVEGERIYPEKGCDSCTCKNGKVECRKIRCNSELSFSSEQIRKGCVPVYYDKKKGCCPIEYKCPEPGDEVRKLSDDSSSDSTNEHTCRFGDKELRKNEELLSGDTICTCDIPPYISCAKKSQL